MKSGAGDILWPGSCHRWAVSSGTSGKGKHLPVTEARLKSDLRFHRLAAWNIVKRTGLGLLRSRAHFSFPGSIEKQAHDGFDIEIGEISGHLARNAAPMLTWMQWMDPAKLAYVDWSEKMQLALTFLDQNAALLWAGAPNWLAHFSNTCRFPKVPRVVVTGGVKLAPFIPELRAKLNPDLLLYENYGASEGYFAQGWQSADDPLELIIDNGIFYEFQDRGAAALVPLWQTEPGREYKLCVSTNSGLWRYLMDDIVSVSWKDEIPQIRISGRDSLILDDFGESVFQYEYERIFEKHNVKSWFVVSSRNLQTGTGSHTILSTPMEVSATTIDQELTDVNRHYAIRRKTGQLALPEIRIEEEEFFIQQANWQLRKVQSKVRRVFPSHMAKCLINWQMRSSRFAD